MIYTTPGIYFEQVDRGRPAVGPLRTDIAGFMGYAERGPLLAPVRLTSWRQFVAVFGEPLTFAYLGEAVRGFFDNGGAVCHVVRVADADHAAAASVTLLDALDHPAVRLHASHGELADSATGRPRIEDGKPARFASPGAWGSRLAVEVLPATSGIANVFPPQTVEGQTTVVDNLTGFQVGSVVRFVQGGKEAPSYRQIRAIVPYLLQIEWDQPLLGLGIDLSQPFRLETRELTLRVLLDGQIVERHEGLSIAAEHSRYLVDAIQTNSIYLDAEMVSNPSTITQPDAWPRDAEPISLSGGRDGLSTVTKAAFYEALDELAKVDEVSVLAAPDLVLQPELPSVQATPPVEVCCESLEPLPRGVIRGRIVTASEAGGEQPVAGVNVTATSAAAPTVVSNRDGSFEIDALPEAQISLRFERLGLYTLDTTAQARTGATDVSVFTMAAIVTPPPLSLDDVAELQSAMARQGEQGLYRVAILDVPSDMLKLDAVQTWRSRFDTAYAALYYPWVQIGDSDAARTVPPSGHIAGLIARTDLSQGVHRAPANYQVEGVKALSNPLNDVEHGILNAQGINALRILPGRGIRVQGARTLSSDTEWTYLNIRRLVLMIEEALEDANQWAVFEPNNTLLRQILSHNISEFLEAMWRQGALAGASPEEAFSVKCDFENNPPAVIDAGQLVADIGVAPSTPFEFIRFRLGRTVDAVAVTE